MGSRAPSGRLNRTPDRPPLLRRWLASGAVAAFALLPACGGGDGGTGPTTPNPNNPGTPTTPTPLPTPPLRDLALAKGLRFGAAAGAGLRWTGTDGTNFRTVLGQQFNSLTPENEMKHSWLHPAVNTYSFANADSIVAFAEASNMQVRGHTLVWHQQIAPWLTGGTWTQAEAESLMVQHIRTVVTHFKGHVVAWDVVNEAFSDNAIRRTTFYSTNVGPAYIEKAFHAARAADSSVKLFYNDYNIEGINAKSDSTWALLQDLRNRGVPVDGIGFQAHFIVGQMPPKAELIQNFQRFAALGLTIHITELDIRMVVPTTGPNLQTQADNYRDLVDACRQVSACTSITTWGFTDRSSWVPNTFPGQGAALPLDENYQPKPAWTAMRTLLATAAAALH